VEVALSARTRKSARQSAAGIRASIDRRQQVLGLLLLSLTLLVLLSLLSLPFGGSRRGVVEALPPNACGPLGTALARAITTHLGLVPALLPTLLLAAWGFNRLRRQTALSLVARSLVVVVLTGSLAGVLGLFRDVDAIWVGRIGAWIAVTATEFLGGLGSHVVLWSGLLIAILAFLDLELTDLISFGARLWFEGRERWRRTRDEIRRHEADAVERHAQTRKTEAPPLVPPAPPSAAAGAASSPRRSSVLAALRGRFRRRGAAEPPPVLADPLARLESAVDPATFRKLRRQERERLAALIAADLRPPRVARPGEVEGTDTGVDAQAPASWQPGAEGSARSDARKAPAASSPAAPPNGKTPNRDAPARQRSTEMGAATAAGAAAAGAAGSQAPPVRGRDAAGGSEGAASGTGLRGAARRVIDRLGRPVREPAALATEGVAAPAAGAQPPVIRRTVGAEEAAPVPEPHPRRSAPRRKSPPRPRGTNYRLPKSGMLGQSVAGAGDISEQSLVRNSRLLERTLSHFDITGKITEVVPGPVITRYAFEPAPGVKVNQVLSRADDLALALRAHRLRLLAPIPGKAAVGIEVPNAKPLLVRLGDIIDAKLFAGGRSTLLIALGKDVAGVPVVADLEKMPHLLIAGATGAGKSVCVNALILSLLLRNTPDRLRLVMVDPKLIELTCYNDIPHLLMPVVTEAKRAARALRYMVHEMQRRYDRLSQAGVRNIEDFNAAVERGAVHATEDDPDVRQLPYVVIVVDELADLMLTLGNEIEDPIARLAQMARAVGIHLVLATQRPSVDVITGMIKANFPSRIAFQVASKVDSRTILDQNGAELLLGRGDMLYLPAGRPDPIRVHGAYVSDREIQDMVRYWRDFAPPTEEVDLDRMPSRSGGGGGDDEAEDELFEEARRIVVQTGVGSTSMLQRRLKVGYARAGRLMDLLEQAAVVGPPDGSKAREVLLKPADVPDL
jgi:S-DNA-T family DNA segregation ATPase FtsK/SpoIIIE